MVGIYKITNPSGKVYIGQSSNIENRIDGYKKIRNVKGQRKLYNSLIKYSPSEHIFEILEECNIEDLNDRERHWQDYYKVLENGLNLKITRSSNRSGKNSDETNKKISNSLMGHEVSEKTKIASSIANKGNKYCLGYKHTSEFLETLKVPILQYTMDGIFIREWDSIKSAALELTSRKNNLKSKASSISNCLNELSSFALGYKWKYK